MSKTSSKAAQLFAPAKNLFRKATGTLREEDLRRYLIEKMGVPEAAIVKTDLAKRRGYEKGNPVDRLSFRAELDSFYRDAEGKMPISNEFLSTTQGSMGRAYSGSVLIGLAPTNRHGHPAQEKYYGKHRQNKGPPPSDHQP